MADAKYVVYQGSDDWSALYVDGKLHRVSDHYLIDEELRSLFGVETVQSDAFLLGDPHASRSAVAPTLEAIEAFEQDLARRAASAAELRAAADRLLARAEAMEPTR